MNTFLILLLLSLLVLVSVLIWRRSASHYLHKTSEGAASHFKMGKTDRSPILLELPEHRNGKEQTREQTLLQGETGTLRQKCLVEMENGKRDVARLRMRLRNALHEGHRGLETQEAQIQQATKIISQAGATLYTIPDHMETATNSTYKTETGKAHLLLKEAKSKCLSTEIYLHRLQRAHRWCVFQLDSLQAFHQSFLERWQWASEKGIDLQKIAPEKQRLSLDIENAAIRYKERTPEAYEMLCGSFTESQDHKNATLVSLLRRLRALNEQLNALQKEYIQAIEKRDYLKEAILDEEMRIIREEGEEYELDLSREALQSARMITAEIDEQIASGRRQAFREVSSRVEEGEQAIQSSVVLRKEFRIHRDYLSDLRAKAFFESYALETQVQKLIDQLDAFHYNFLHEGKDQRRILRELVQSVTQSLQQAAQETWTKQSGLARACELSEAAKEKRKKLTSKQEALSRTLQQYETSFKRLQHVDACISKLYENLHACAQKHPLAEWAAQHKEVDRRLSAWAKRWRQRQGPLFAHQIVEGEDLIQEILQLREQFDIDKEIWREAIEKYWKQMDALWKEFHGRYRHPPRPSIAVDDLERQLEDLQQEYELLQQQPYARKMQLFYQKIGVQMDAIAEREEAVAREDEELRAARVAAEMAIANAVQVYKGLQTDLSKFANGGWTCLDSAQATALHEELQQQERRFHSLIDYPRTYSTAALAHEIREVANSLRHICERLGAHRRHLVEYREKIIAWNRHVDRLFRDLKDRIEADRVSQSGIAKLKLCLEEVDWLISQAREETSFGRCEQLLQEASRGIEGEIGSIYYLPATIMDNDEVFNDYLQAGKNMLLRELDTVAQSVKKTAVAA